MNWVRLQEPVKTGKKAWVSQQKFRADLYYRLSVVPMVIPPLRERKEDVIPLIEFFLNRFNKKFRLAKNIAPGVQDIFLWYDWPGNIRELRNIIERLMVTSESDTIYVEDVLVNTEIKETSTAHHIPRPFPEHMEVNLETAYIWKPNEPNKKGDSLIFAERTYVMNEWELSGPFLRQYSYEGRKN